MFRLFFFWPIFPGRRRDGSGWPGRVFIVYTSLDEEERWVGATTFMYIRVFISIFILPSSTME